MRNKGWGPCWWSLLPLAAFYSHPTSFHTSNQAVVLSGGSQDSSILPGPVSRNWAVQLVSGFEAKEQ